MQSADHRRGIATKHKSLASDRSRRLSAWDRQAYSCSRHGHLRQWRQRSPGSAPSWFSLPHSLQHRPQGDRSALPLACPGQVLLGMLLSLLMRVHWSGRASIFRFFPDSALAGTLHRAHNAAWLVDGFPGAYHGAASRLRQLFLAAANWRAGNGVPRSESVSVLGYGSLARWHDRAFFVIPMRVSRFGSPASRSFAAASLTALNFSVTTLDLRAKGMTLPRLPLTVWAWFINAILSMLIFSILLAACVFFLSDRLFGSQFFSLLSFLAQPAGVPRAVQLLLSGSASSGFSRKPKFTSPCFRVLESSRICSPHFRASPFGRNAPRFSLLCGVGFSVFAFGASTCFPAASIRFRR